MPPGAVAPALPATTVDEPYWVAISQRSYVVTGASTGIGRACVDALVRTGAHVWASVRADADGRQVGYTLGPCVPGSVSGGLAG